jgi:NAD(P)-dependent dehydrogenase (short-subunit alcohol dehydrogenase family)
VPKRRDLHRGAVVTYQVAFSGQVAIVTGAGRGMGLEHAVELARRGARVVVNDVNGEAAEQVVADISDFGGEAVAAVGSVASVDGAYRIVDVARQAYGTVHIVVNNAGILRAGYFESLQAGDLSDLLNTNLAGALWVTQAAWPLMREQRHGRVIFTSSSSGMFSHQGVAGYAAAKAGLYGVTKALAFEGKESNIFVNAILPIAQGQQEAGNPIPGRAEYFGDVFDSLRSRMTPKTVTSMVVYLVSRACELTGEAYSVVAGRYCRVFVAETEGWLSPSANQTTVEDIQQNIAKIREMNGLTVPSNLIEEVRIVRDLIRERG